MVARVWTGKTKNEYGDIYTKFIEDRDIPDYRETEGFVKLTFLKRSDNDFTHFELITFWEGIESVKNFTGPDYENAVGHENDKEYLVDFPGSVLHYEVFADNFEIKRQ